MQSGVGRKCSHGDPLVGPIRQFLVHLPQPGRRRATSEDLGGIPGDEVPKPIEDFSGGPRLREVNRRQQPGSHPPAGQPSPAHRRAGLREEAGRLELEDNRLTLEAGAMHRLSRLDDRLPGPNGDSPAVAHFGQAPGDHHRQGIVHVNVVEQPGS